LFKSMIMHHIRPSAAGSKPVCGDRSGDNRTAQVSPDKLNANCAHAQSRSP